MIEIRFTNEDIEYARHIVAGRNEWKRRCGIPPPKSFGGRSKVNDDFHGALAEIAVCKFLELPLSEVKIISPFEKDIGFDITYYDKKIEVKYTYHEGGHILHRPFRKITADYYILAVGNEISMRLKGYCTGEEMRHAKLMNFGYDYCSAYAIAQSQLHDISKLKVITKGPLDSFT